MTRHVTPRKRSRREMLLQMGAATAGFAGTPRALAAQDATPQSGKVSVQTGVVYGEAGGQRLLLDVYALPAYASPRPAVMLIHGGGWKFGIGGPADMAAPARYLARLGYVAFSIGYRRTGDPAGEFRWPDQLDDVQRAVRWVRANAVTYGVDPDRIGAYGFSAGGHLAAHLAVRDTRDDSILDLAGISSRVTCTVTLAGLMDMFLPALDSFAVEVQDALLGGAPEDEPDAYQDASPMSWVDSATVPFLIIHGGSDVIVSPDHGRTMTTAIHDVGTEVIHAEFPSVDHVTIADWAVAGPWALTFFERHLHPAV